MADRNEMTEREPSHRRPLALVLVAGTVVVLAIVAWRLPREDSPLPAVARYATEIAIPRWHTTEPVNEVVYGTRGFDTFGETFLLLAAVVSISAVSRSREPRRGFIGEETAGQAEKRAIGNQSARSQGSVEREQARGAEEEEQGERDEPETPDAEPLGTPGPEVAQSMTVIVRAAVRIVTPLLLVAGLYLVAWGYSPGGGFPGGAVLLGGVLLAYVGYGHKKVQPVVRPSIVEPVELVFALVIVAVEALGLLLRGSFSANFLPLGSLQTIRSGGVLQAFSVSELVEVATGLILAVFGLLSMAHDWSDTEGRK